MPFGDGAQFDLGYRFQHLSITGLEPPHVGINFQQARFACQF